jgi:hypothetical protein
VRSEVRRWDSAGGISERRREVKISARFATWNSSQSVSPSFDIPAPMSGVVNLPVDSSCPPEP